MTEAFVAFVRFEEKLLLLKRNSSTEHFRTYGTVCGRR